MSLRSGNRVLVLGGIRSGKSHVAESLVRSGRPSIGLVRYVATGVPRGDDPAWSARLATHRARRPADWLTEEVGDDPARLARLIAEAGPDDVLLVDDLGGWLTATLDAGDAMPGWDDPASADPSINVLTAAIAGCRAARLVVVGPEVGMSLVPTTPVGRMFADVQGLLNQRVAAVCDAVVLVVAGQAVWLVGPPAWLDRPGRLPESEPPEPLSAAFAEATRELPLVVPVTPSEHAAPAATRWPEPTVVGHDATTAATPTGAHAATEAELPTGGEPATDVDRHPAPDADPGAGPDASSRTEPGTDAAAEPLQVGLDLPLPDDTAAGEATDRLATLRFDGTGLGGLTPVVRFAAGAQGVNNPRPWQNIRVLLLRGDHRGDASAGDPATAADARLAQIRDGSGALSLLASGAGATIAPVTCPPSEAIEERNALDEATVDAAIAAGQRLADEAVDAGVDLLVLAACGSGSETAAVAVTAVLTGGEAAALLARVVTADGTVHDDAWMARCAAVRDALHRVHGGAVDPRSVLLTLGGGDLAVATGVLLGATARKTPVLIDGPVGAAAALLARDYSAESRHWVLLPDTGNHPMLRLVADTLSLIPILDLKLGLGEGATALAVLPLLRSALILSGSVPVAAPAEPTDAADPIGADPIGSE